MKLNDLLALTVKQLASLQENDLYLLRILFEIGFFFSSSSDCLLKLLCCPVSGQQAQHPTTTITRSFSTAKRLIGSSYSSKVDFRLPSMWPGFKSWRRRHMWVEFVVGFLLCSESFFSGYSSFPFSSQSNISKFQFDQE